MNSIHPQYIPSAMPEEYIHYRKSLLSGVEIKRCKGNPYDYKTHVHNELSLGYIQTGSTELTLQNQTLHFEQGDGVLIPPLVSHSCAPNDITQWEYVMLYIRPEYYAGTLRFAKPARLMGQKAETAVYYIKKLLQENDPDTAETLLLELLLAVCDSAEPAAMTGDKQAVQTIHDYIISHLYEPVTLQQLEQLSGLTKFTLIRSFKKEYVTTPASFHLQCRVAEAKKRLSGGSDVLTVCNDLLFFDQAHLIREFRKMYGVTPAAYIAQLRR